MHFLLGYILPELPVNETSNIPPSWNTVIRLALLFLYSAFLLMWLSPDSFLMHEWGSRGDSAWFFTCGKAWMEGMTPYVDFSDSKGPLLWLVYGLSYLLSPTTYTAVYAFSVVALVVAMEFTWRTSRLFAGRRTAVVAVVVLSLLALARPVHNETQAEDFCLPWISMALYYTCATMLSPSRRLERTASFWIGVCMACCLLIKWNVFFMMGGMALVVAGWSLGRKRVDGLVCGLIGIVVVCLPFAVLFAFKGNFAAFVQEYFVNTFLITDNGNGVAAWIAMLSGQIDLYMIFRMALLLSAMGGVCLFCHRYRFSWWLAFACLPFFLFLLFKANALHYCITMMPFFVFAVLFLSRWLTSAAAKLPDWAFAVLLVITVLANMAVDVHKENLRFIYNEYSHEWNAMQKILTAKHQPLIMFNVADNGVGLKSRALPSCKYYAKQKAATADMTAQRIEVLRRRIPDFYAFIMEPDAQTQALLQSCGYRRCYATEQIAGKSKRIALSLFRK